MSRPKNEDRSTPYTDAWRERIRSKLAARGQKAELAAFLCHGDPSKIDARKVQISKMLHQGSIPNAEFLLAVEAWIQAQEPS